MLKVLVSIIGLALAFSIADADTKFRVTNYYPTKEECGNTKGITASGHPLKVGGLCAADWRIYPPGTIIKLDTSERLIVADTGSAVTGKNHIDRGHAYKDRQVFPQVSRGIIIYRGDRNWRRKGGAYTAVTKSIYLRKQLIRKAKENELRNKNIQQFFDRGSYIYEQSSPRVSFRSRGLLKWTEDNTYVRGYYLK